MRALWDRLDHGIDWRIAVPKDAVPPDLTAGIVLYPSMRFDPSIPVEGGAELAAIPFSHSHPELYGYYNVEGTAAASGAKEVLRLFRNGLLSRGEPVGSEREERALAALEARRRGRIEELAYFTGESFDLVEEKIETAEERGFGEWRKKAPKGREKIEAFYRSSDFYLYQLTSSNFFEGGRTEYLPEILRLLPPRARILDLGCGVGEVSLALAAKGHEVTASDINERLLDFISFKGERRGIRIETLDPTSAVSPDGAFDAVLLLDLLEHLSDPADTLRKIIGALAPGGLILIRLPSDDEDPVPMHMDCSGTVEGSLLHHGFRRMNGETDLDIWKSGREG